MLYPINENTEVPKNALSSEIWNIPEGYYAIEIRDLDQFPNLFIYFYFSKKSISII